MIVDENSLAFKRTRLSHALGEAVSRWINVEFAILQIFSTSAEVPIALGATILRNAKSFSLVLDICDSVVRYRLKNNSQIAHWKSLVNYARELSSDRNYIAHTAMVLHGPGTPHDVNEKLVIPMIGPNLLIGLAGDEQKRPPVDHAEVNEMCADFQHLVESLHKFVSWLEAKNYDREPFSIAELRRRPRRLDRKT